ncbi:MAG: hypothetical protein FJ303_01755 [Planctomycetes bacterium]|nr:hypothetical protein [Planctomycetota bacterium]
MPGGKQNWIEQMSGSFKGDPDFGEILRLGREIRDAEGPDEGDGDARCLSLTRITSVLSNGNPNRNTLVYWLGLASMLPTVSW